MKVNYQGEKPSQKSLKRWEIEPEGLYAIAFFTKTPPREEEAEAVLSKGKDLSKVVQLIRSEGKISIFGPIRIMGEEQ